MRTFKTWQGRIFKAYRKGVQAVFQDPYSSLNPRMRVGDIIGEPLVVNEALSKAKLRERVQELLNLVGLQTRLDRICFRTNSVAGSGNASPSRGPCR